MKAVVYRRSEGYVLEVVEQVISVNGGNVTGKDRELRGIDLSVAGITVVDDSVKVKAGDKNFDPSKFEDRSGSIPKSAEQLRDQRLADLEMALADYFANGGA